MNPEGVKRKEYGPFVAVSKVDMAAEYTKE